MDNPKAPHPRSAAEEKKKIRDSMEASVKDGCAWSVMDGIGTQYMTPFAYAMNAGEVEIGFLTSIPQLVSSFIQPVGARLAHKWSRKQLVVLSAFVQALMWIPILLIPFVFGNGAKLVFFFSLVALFGSILVPAWTSMMGDLVPQHERGAYFGRRNKISVFVTVVSSILAAFILYFFRNYSDNVFYGFSVLFFIAFLARVVSGYYLNRMHEPHREVEEHYVSFMQFFKRVRKESFGNFLIYIGLINFTTQVAGPFFTLFALKTLGFDYIQYAIMFLVVPPVARMFSMPYWGRLGDFFGNKAIISITGMLVPVVPLLWLISQDFYFLLVVQVLAGFVWAGFELAAFNYLLDATPRNRASYVAHYNVVNGFAIFMGASIGGFIAAFLVSSGVSILWWHGLLLLFGLSGILRLLVSLAMIPKLKEIRGGKTVSEHLIFWKVVAEYPARGIVQEFSDGWTNLAVFSRRIRDKTISIDEHIRTRVGNGIKKNVERIGKHIPEELK
ncbi:MFS transporter [Candidatus Micrarchaeota archaeon]|nr:MFS transporter [Candidatus Micrarchaeota archaeon]